MASSRVGLPVSRTVQAVAVALLFAVSAGIAWASYPRDLPTFSIPADLPRGRLQQLSTSPGGRWEVRTYRYDSGNAETVDVRAQASQGDHTDAEPRDIYFAEIDRDRGTPSVAWRNETTAVIAGYAIDVRSGSVYVPSGPGDGLGFAVWLGRLTEWGLIVVLDLLLLILGLLGILVVPALVTAGKVRAVVADTLARLSTGDYAGAAANLTPLPPRPAESHESLADSRGAALVSSRQWRIVGSTGDLTFATPVYVVTVRFDAQRPPSADQDWEVLVVRAGRRWLIRRDVGLFAAA